VFENWPKSKKVVTSSEPDKIVIRISYVRMNGTKNHLF